MSGVSCVGLVKNVGQESHPTVIYHVLLFVSVWSVPE